MRSESDQSEEFYLPSGGHTGESGRALRRLTFFKPTTFVPAHIKVLLKTPALYANTPAMRIR